MPAALSATSDAPVIDDAAAQAAAAEAANATQDDGAATGETTPTADELQVQEAAAKAAQEAAEQAEEAAAQEAFKNAKVNKRFNEANDKAKKAQREADEAKRKLELAEAAVADLTARATPPKKDPADELPEKPTFEDPEQYAEAMADYTDKLVAYRTRTALKTQTAEAEKARAESDAKDAQTKIQKGFQSRVEAFKAETPDYDDVVNNPDITISTIMAVGIANNPAGPKIAYHLGKNPGEAERIAALNPAEQLMELGMLAKQLATPVVRKTNAAAPIRPVSGGTSGAAKDIAEMSMEEYAAHRAARKH